MSTYIVFYAQQVYDESNKWFVPYDLPDGAYQRTPTGKWYLINWGMAIPINDVDVPVELKALCFLMGLHS